jgi:hypothetical protein
MIDKFNEYKAPLNEVTRWDILRRSQREAPKRFDKKKYYKAKDFNNVDFKDLFENNNFTWSSRVGDYIVTLSFEGAFDILRWKVKSWSGTNRWKRLNHKLLTDCLTEALDRRDLYIDCTCPDFCLVEDTKIKLLNDEVVNIKELFNKYENGEDIWVYSTNDKGDFKPGHVTDVWVSGFVTDLVEVTLDNGKTITTTPNHKYMLRTGDYLQASKLTVGQSLMPKHTVAKINNIILDKPVPVYDLTVDTYNNFYVDAGVILHNCYRFAFWATKAKCKYGLQQNVAPKVRNVRNNKGYCCKHILSVLYGKRWVPAAAKRWLQFIQQNPILAEWYIWEQYSKKSTNRHNTYQNSNTNEEDQGSDV